MSEDLKRSIINLITKKKTKKSSDKDVIQTAFKDFKKKLKRNHSVGKAWLKSDDKSIFWSRSTRTSSVNYNKREADVQKFYNICNSESSFASSELSCVSLLSEKSKDSVKISEKQQPLIKKIVKKKIKCSPKKSNSHHTAFLEARSQLK